MNRASRYDFVVIGAGVFGAWTALHLARRNKRVLLVDAYGVAHSRASSGGESRIIRMGYGADELYTRWSQNSLAQWKEFFGAAHLPLFQQTGVLWLARQNDERLHDTIAVLTCCGVRFETLNRDALEKRYPQIAYDGIDAGVLEPESGVLMARRAVAAVVEDALRLGAEFRIAKIEGPRNSDQPSGQIDSVATSDGQRIEADCFVFACGAWMANTFPEILGSRIFPTRQEVFFFGTAAGETRFAPPALPTWLFQGDEYYGMPDLEGRGFKIALDRHGERVDPDTQSRTVSQDSADAARAYVAKRFPALRDAPITETRVCQYENTSNGDFLIDRHPEIKNLWFVGGGSGHGFKHGPAVGEYVTARVLDGATAEPRFSFASKTTVQQRAVW